MQKMTGAEVMETLMANEEFAAQPLAVIEVMRPFIEKLPELIEDMLPEKVTLVSLSEAKLRFLMYAMNNGFIDAVVRATPESSLGMFSIESMIELFESIFSEALQIYEAVIKDLPAFLVANGVTEEEILLGPQVGLSSELAAKYQQGTLTIGELLRQQPFVIVKNS